MRDFNEEYESAAHGNLAVYQKRLSGEPFG